MTPFPFLAAFAALVCMAGASAVAEEQKDNKLPDAVQAVLDKAGQIELYSLDPEAKRDDTGFRGWKVLGKTALKGDAARKQLLAPLAQGIAKSDGNGAKCFEPRHGVRAAFDGRTVDLVICFECSWVYVFTGKDDNRLASVATTGAPQAAFDAALAEAKVALPKPAKK